MNRSSRRAFTLVELLVVIAIIGILVSMMLPAVQSAREGARRAHCSNNLLQLVMGVLNYESAFRLYPSGTIEAAGPIKNVNQGYHHSWITRVLPYIEQRNAYRHINRSEGVYHASNVAVRDLNLTGLRCPSSNMAGPGYSCYAGVHHDVESPIDVNNHGVFFLNSRVRYLDVTDGSSQTLFLGEKIPIAGDLGWMSGTRATLRNTGTPMNAVLVIKTSWRGRKLGVPSQEGFDGAMPGMMMGEGGAAAGASFDGAGPPPSSAGPSLDNGVANQPDTNQPDAANDRSQGPAPPIVDGRPTNDTAVGGFESDHPGGVHFAFGDGSVRFLAETMDAQVYQQLGHRADGKLLNQDF